MKLFNRYSAALFSALPLAICAFSAAAQVVQEYEYAPDRIYQVRTGLGITTQVELSPNEKILDYSTGFTGGWELTRRENVFYLKPKNVDVDTNMMIRTATHSYILELKVVATDWQRLESRRSRLASNTRSCSPIRRTQASTMSKTRIRRRKARC